MIKIIISTLRRSGSTIFWKVFRQATDAVCFDEPFNPKLIQLPLEHKKKVLQEYINLLHKEKENFWELLSPIYPLDELNQDLSQRQCLYLQFLLNQNQQVIIDTTRCWNKIEYLRKITPKDTFFIHLYRNPASFVTSHLLPSDDHSRGSILRNFRRKIKFWTEKEDFNRWNMKDVTGSQLLSCFHTQILKNDSLAEQFYNSSAAYRLFKFWVLVFEQVEKDGYRFFGDNFISVPFEQFCSSPLDTLKQIQTKTKVQFNYDNLPKILPSKSPYMANHENWQSICEYWDLPSDKFLTFRTN